MTRVDPADKRALFVGAAMWSAFHLFGLAVLVFGHSASPLIAALIFDAFGALIAGLAWVARRLFPDDPDQQGAAR